MISMFMYKEMAHEVIPVFGCVVTCATRPRILLLVKAQVQVKQSLVSEHRATLTLERLVSPNEFIQNLLIRVLIQKCVCLVADHVFGHVC